MSTRSEHIEWCKQRAREYYRRGEPDNALLSMIRDLDRHPETAGHQAARVALILRGMAEHSSTQSDVLEFIDNYK